MARYSGSTHGSGFGGPNMIAYGAAKQRNRQMRNDVDARSAITGITWKQGEQMWRDEYGKTGMKLSHDSNMHLQQIYDLMGSGNNLKPASAASGPASDPNASYSAAFNKQLADIKAQNSASMAALNKQLADQKTDYDAREAAANQKISGLASTVANAQSQYDPMKGMQSSNNINPALTIQEKDKSLSSGTQRYTRNKLSINNLNV